MATEEIESSYLSGIVSSTNYENGQLKECMLGCACEVQTQYGVFIAHYDDGGDRTRYCNSISFYKDGSIKRLALHEQVEIKTEAGEYKAQNLMFHRSGRIKRVFPLNGKTTGFWTEQNEYDLAEDTIIQVGEFIFEEKVISVQFYESGVVKSITFWPQARPEVYVGQLTTPSRHGVSFFENGSISSFEPAKPVLVQTLIGAIHAYDSAPVGVHGDLNSLRLDPKGNILELKNSTDIIVVKKDGEEVDVIRHDRTPHWCNENLTMPVSMNVSFEKGVVSFGEDKSYIIEDYEFDILHNKVKIPFFHC